MKRPEAGRKARGGGKLTVTLSAALACLTVLVGCSAAAETVLFDFETEAERRIAPSIRTGAFSVCVTNRLATSGAHSLLFECRRWEKGMPEWPSFTMPSPIADWSAYDRLVVDIVNIGDGGDKFGLYIAGPDGSITAGFHYQRPLPSNGHMRWVVPLARLGKVVPLDRVARIHFHTERPMGFSAAIDNLVLLKPGEPLPEAVGNGILRDLLPVVASERDELARKLSEVECELGRQRFRAGCMANRPEETAFLLGEATSMEKILPRGRRTPFCARPLPRRGLSIRLARNEYESAQMLVSPFAGELRNVKVALSGDLRGGGGRVFPASAITCSMVGYVLVTNSTPYMTGFTIPADGTPGYERKVGKPEQGWWPDPILDFLGAANIARGDVQSYWIRVHCPDGQPAGDYRGSLTVSADGKRAVAVPLSVRVNDFTLGKASPLPLAITFNPTPYWVDKDRSAELWGDPNAPVNAWKRHEAEWCDFLADYFITIQSMYDGRARFDLLERLKSQGRLGWYALAPLWNPPASTNSGDMAAWRARNIERFGKAYEEAKRRGLLEKAFIYGCDEVSSGRFPAMRLAAEELKKRFPEVPLATTAYDESYGTASPLDGFDWFTPLTMSYTKGVAATARKKGNKVWWYVCNVPSPPAANMFIESQAIESRVLMGAQAQRMRPDGFLYWRIGLWHTAKCIESGPFTDWEPRSYGAWHGDGSWVCAGPDGTPLPTIRLENFRDGLEDYAYAKLLEQKLRVVESSKLKVEGDRGAWISRAKAALAVPREVMDSMTNYTDDPAVLYRWRDEMADLIEEATK